MTVHQFDIHTGTESGFKTFIKPDVKLAGKSVFVGQPLDQKRLPVDTVLGLYKMERFDIFIQI